MNKVKRNDKHSTVILIEAIAIIVAIIIVLLVGLLSNDNVLFFSGLFLTFIGFFVGFGLYQGGLIFLVPYGGIGTILMMSSFIDKIWKNPILSDGFTVFQLLLIISILMILISFVLIFIFNLNKKARKANCFVILPFVFYSLGFLIIGIMCLLPAFNH